MLFAARSSIFIANFEQVPKVSLLLTLSMLFISKDFIFDFY